MLTTQIPELMKVANIYKAFEEKVLSDFALEILHNIELPIDQVVEFRAFTDNGIYIDRWLKEHYVAVIQRWKEKEYIRSTEQTLFHQILDDIKLATYRALTDNIFLTNITINNVFFDSGDIFKELDKYYSNEGENNNCLVYLACYAIYYLWIYSGFTGVIDVEILPTMIKVFQQDVTRYNAHWNKKKINNDVEMAVWNHIDEQGNIISLPEGISDWIYDDDYFSQIAGWYRSRISLYLRNKDLENISQTKTIRNRNDQLNYDKRCNISKVAKQRFNNVINNFVLKQGVIYTNG